MSAVLPEPQLHKLSQAELIECFTAFDDFLEEQVELLRTAARFAECLVEANASQEKFAPVLQALRRARSQVGEALASFRTDIGWYARQAKLEREQHQFTGPIVEAE